MRITFVSPRLAIEKADLLGSGVPYWPLEVAIAAAFLRDRRHDVHVLDLFGSAPWALEERADHFLQGSAIERFFGESAVERAEVFVLYAISSMSHADLLATVQKLRAHRPDAFIVALENTQAVTAYALSEVGGDFFSSGADGVICGELYWNWDDLEAWMRGGPPPPNAVVPGVSVPPTRFRPRHPSFPVPAFDLLPVHQYWRLPYSHGPRSARFLPVLTSRGCSFPCDFCVVPETSGRLWRGRSPEEVVDEWISLRDRFGVRHFQVEDLNPTTDSRRWRAICELLVERRADVTYSFVSGTKAETVPVDDVPLYARSGCRYLSMSPESGSVEVLKAAGKKFDHEHGLRLAAACRRHGIATQACFLVGHPAETDADHLASRRYLQALLRAGLDEAAFFVVAPLAGSRLNREQRIEMSVPERLVTFSSKGRSDWSTVARRRAELIRVLLGDRLRQPAALLASTWRALFGAPFTKMENLPRRVLYMLAIRLRHRLLGGRA